MLVTLTATFLSFTVEKEWDFVRFAASVNFFDWSQSNCGFLFPCVVNKCSDCFCWHWWYCYAIVNDASLKFSTRFACCASDLHCQVGKMHEVMCSVDNHSLCLLKCNPRMVPEKFLITTEYFARLRSPILNLSVAVAIGFSNKPFAT